MASLAPFKNRKRKCSETLSEQLFYFTIYMHAYLYPRLFATFSGIFVYLIYYCNHYLFNKSILTVTSVIRCPLDPDLVCLQAKIEKAASSSFGSVAAGCQRFTKIVLF